MQVIRRSMLTQVNVQYLYNIRFCLHALLRTHFSLRVDGMECIIRTYITRETESVAIVCRYKRVFDAFTFGWWWW